MHGADATSLPEPAGGATGWLRGAAELGKLRISAMVTVTSATGFLLFARQWTLEIWTATVGTFFLAAAASALNQLQEARQDALMARTRRRPLPSGRIDRGSAVFIGLIWAGFGLSALASAPGDPLAAAGLGLIAMVWYNGLYTPLKRWTAFAVLPGAVIGSLPPMIGWAAAGGSIANPVILLVAAFFFVWQVPHFWLLALRHGEDYRRASYPVLSDHFDPTQIGRMTFAWIAATATAGLLLGGMLRIDWVLYGAVVAASLWLVFTSRGLARLRRPGAALHRSFVRINAYALLLCAVLVIDALTR